MPEVLSTARGRRPRDVLKNEPRQTGLQKKDEPRQTGFQKVFLRALRRTVTVEINL